MRCRSRHDQHLFQHQLRAVNGMRQAKWFSMVLIWDMSFLLHVMGVTSKLTSKTLDPDHIQAKANKPSDELPDKETVTTKVKAQTLELKHQHQKKQNPQPSFLSDFHSRKHTYYYNKHWHTKCPHAWHVFITCLNLQVHFQRAGGGVFVGRRPPLPKSRILKANYARNKTAWQRFGWRGVLDHVWVQLALRQPISFCRGEYARTLMGKQHLSGLKWKADHTWQKFWLSPSSTILCVYEILAHSSHFPACICWSSTSNSSKHGFHRQLTYRVLCFLQWLHRRHWSCLLQVNFSG